MACVITYNNKKYSQPEFNEYFKSHFFEFAIDFLNSKVNVILPIGTSGSGKSTFIKSLPQENLVVIEPDAMRVEFTGDINNKSKDKEIYEEAAKRAVAAIKQGKQVVFDTTNLTKDKRLPFIETIKKEIPNANIQYKLMELNPELAKQRIKAQIARGENRANVSDSTIDRHAESYKQMLEDIKSEPITEFKGLGSNQDVEGFKEFVGNKKDVLYQNESLEQAKKRILKKVNANYEGYVKPKKYGELLSLVAQYNKNSQAGKLRIIKTGYNDYYLFLEHKALLQKNPKDLRDPNKELEERLLGWAKNNGISVEAIKDLKERFAGRYSDGILGVADFANQLIGLAENRTITTLAEEVGHFAIRILKDKKDPSILRALSLVSQTSEYQDVLQEYEGVYTETDQFLEEALGQIVAKILVGESVDKIPGPENNSFFNYLKAIKEKFLKWLSDIFSTNKDAKKEIQEIILPLAQSILKGETLEKSQELNSIKNLDLLYQLEEPQESQKSSFANDNFDAKKKFLKESIEKLEERLVTVKRGANKNNLTLISTIEKDILKLQKLIVKDQFDLAIITIAERATEELEATNNALKKQLSLPIPNKELVARAMDFTDMYFDLFQELKTSIYAWDLDSEEIDLLNNATREATSLLGEISPKLNVLSKKIGILELKEANTDAYGQKLDTTFDEEKAFNETAEDLSSYRLWVGNFKNAKSHIIRTALKIIFDSVQNVKRFATKTSNELLQAQSILTKAGHKVTDIVEHVDGKPTHYFIREYHWAKYYAEMEKVQQTLVEHLGVENYSQINKELLGDLDLELYRTLWKDFREQHSVKRKITTILPDGSVDIEYKTLPNDSYKNKEFEEKMKNPAIKQYYDAVIEKQREAVNKLPKHLRTESLVYRLPGIHKSFVERLDFTKKHEESFLSRVGRIAKDVALIEGDETQFGELSEAKRLNNKMVPIHFIRKMDNIDDLSMEITKSVSIFAEMAENYQEMNKTSLKLRFVQKGLEEKLYINVNKKRIDKGKQGSNELRALELLLDTQVFGIERNSLATEIPSNSITDKLGISGKKISATKISQKFTNFIRDNNLAFNFATAISGLFKGTIDSNIEDSIGLHTTIESKNWARKEFLANLPHITSEIGKAKQTNKLHLLMLENGIVSLEDLLRDSTKNRAIRKTVTKDLLYTPFASGDYILKGQITLAVMDNYRLYEGQFLTRQQFFNKTENLSEKEKKALWKSLQEKSLYNAVEVSEKGTIVAKKEFKEQVSEALLNAVAGRINHVTHTVDGTMGTLDKGALSRTILGDFLLMHRGWFLNLIDAKFKGERFNTISSEEEIGDYRAMSNFTAMLSKSIIKNKLDLKASLAVWNNLSPAKKRGVKKTALDLLYLNIVAILAAMANVAADDNEEDWTLQYVAFQLNRILLEQSAAWSPSEVANMIDEPVVGARMIKDLIDITESFNFTEIYESGMYKGDSHAEKWWFKKLPIKNLYELQYPDMKNKFIKKMVDSNWYELLSPEQKTNVGILGSFKNYFWNPQPLNTEEEESAYVGELIGDLENQEQYNGFN